jgi:hypothetical protein
VGLWHSAQRQVTTNLLMELPFFEGNVFNSRIPVLRRDLLPCARIYTTLDQRTPETALNVVSPHNGLATLTVQVTVEAAADPACSDLLDLYVEAVEIKLLGSQAWLCNIAGIQSVDTVYELDALGEMRTANANVTFGLRYWEPARDVVTDLDGALLPTLERVLLQIDMIDPAADPNTTGHPTAPPDGYPGGYPGPDGRIELSAAITLPEVPPPRTPGQPQPPPGGSPITTRRVQ